MPGRGECPDVGSPNKGSLSAMKFIIFHTFSAGKIPNGEIFKLIIGRVILP